MSAYVVSLDTIDYLVEAAAKYRVAFHAPLDPTRHAAAVLAAAPVDYSGNTFRISGSDPNTVGAILHAQNVLSVNARYNDAEPIEDYDYTPVSYERIDPVTVLKSVACLRYQSCETDDYSTSFACAMLDTLEHAAIHALKGYEDAPWGWTRTKEAAR